MEQWIIQTSNTTNKIDQHTLITEKTNLDLVPKKQGFLTDSYPSFSTSETETPHLLQLKYKNGTEEQTPPIAVAVWTKRQQGCYQSKFSNNAASTNHYVIKGLQHQLNESQKNLQTKGQRCDAATTPRIEYRMQFFEVGIGAVDQNHQTTCIPTTSKEDDQLLRHKLELLQANYDTEAERHRSITEENQNLRQNLTLYEQIAAEREDLQNNTRTLNARQTTTSSTTQQIAEASAETELLQNQHNAAPAQQTTTVKNQIQQEPTISQTGIVTAHHRNTASPHHLASQQDNHMLQ